MNKFFCTFLLIAMCLIGGCKNKEAIEKYNQEKQALETMKIQHRMELDRAIATGASQWEISLLKIEQAEEEMKQADRVYKFAKEAGVE